MNEPLFNLAAIRPGDIVSRFAPSFVQKMICWATGQQIINHDAIFVQTSLGLRIGDALMNVGCQLTDPAEWERGCREDGHRIVVLRPAGATEEQGFAASRWWAENVHGRRYDKVAIFRLGLKAIFGDLLPGKVGLESHFFCSEGVRDAWALGGRNNPWWPKLNTTPGTTVKRWRSGRLVVVAGALTAEGQKYAAKLD